MKQTIFRAREARAPLFTAIFVVVGLMAFGSQAKAANLGGTATLTTDCVWRGSIQTQGDDYAGSCVEAARQASF